MMRSDRLLFAAILGVIVACVPARAQSIEIQGVIGNSGVAGPSLIRHKPPKDARAGVYWAEDSTLWVSGGDAILHTTLDGRLLERHALPGSVESVNSWTFAALDQTLYFWGTLTQPNQVKVGEQVLSSRVALLCLPMKPQARAQIVKAFSELPDHIGGRIAPQPMGRELLIAQLVLPQTNPPTWQLHAFDPRSGQSRVLFNTGAQRIGGLAFDAANQKIYVGGYWGKYVASRGHHPNPWEIVAFNPAGKELARTTVLSTEAIPTEYRGFVSLTDDAVWDVAWYGFLGRFDRDLNQDPGTVQSWNIDLGFACQVAELPRLSKSGASESGDAKSDALAISTFNSIQTIVARWDRPARKLQTVLRIGALPAVSSISLSDDGWISVGTPGVQSWWRWDDQANTPASFGNNGAALTRGVFYRGALVAPLQPRDADPGKPAPPLIAAQFTPDTARGSCDPAHNENWPTRTPLGYVLGTDGKAPTARAWTVEAQTGKVWYTTVEARTGLPNAKNWKQVELTHALERATSMTQWPDHHIAVAADGVIWLVPLQTSAPLSPKSLTISGLTNGDSLGEVLHLAWSGSHLWISDTAHHRVLIVDASGRVLAAYGQNKQAGNSLEQFNTPTALAALGNRAAVYDSGNQRIVRLQYQEARTTAPQQH